MSFAIAVLSYNHPELTSRCLNSILALGRVQPEQIFLAHNGSLPQHRDRLITAFPKIHHLILEQNKGFSGGANSLLQQAFTVSSWVFFITNDCELISLGVVPDREGIYAPQIFLRKTDRMDSVGGAIHLESLSLSHCKSETEFLGSSIKYIPGSAFWISKSVFDRLRGFDEGFGTYWEDVDLSYRAMHMDISLGLDPSTKIRHGSSKTTGKHKDYTLFFFQKNRLRFFSKHRLWTFRRRLYYTWDLTRLCLRLIRQKRSSDALKLLKQLYSST
jgi:GT2 family glycosyltransferase